MLLHHSGVWGCHGPPHPIQYSPAPGKHKLLPPSAVVNCGLFWECRRLRMKNTALQSKSSSYTFPTSSDLSRNCVVKGSLPIFTLGFRKTTAVGHVLVLPLLAFTREWASCCPGGLRILSSYCKDSASHDGENHVLGPF